MKRLLNLLRRPWLLSLLGLIALAVIVWFLGPLLSFAGWEPLVSATGRLVAIAVLAALWGLNRLRRAWQAKRTNQAILDGLTSGAAEAPAGPAPGEVESAEELATIRKRFEEALAVLKQSRLKHRFGRHYIYELPWYVIIGPPGSGKTTALLNSGLHFPLAERFGQDAIRGVGGTRNCDWWFTDEAVLLDTAGRYTTQDSFESVDRAAWMGFLKLLKRHRRRRPINGVLVAVSVADLLQQSEGERAAHARAIKQRIHELHQEFGIRFPIYFTFTKCDLVAGFMEFFADLGREERAQVWGMTFPAEETETEAGLVRHFGPEFDALLQRLNARLVERLQAERDPQRRNLIYTFPQQFGTLKTLLEPFLGEIFQPSRFETPPQLRGVYFTSGTQEGSPIDRVMGSVAASFRLDRQSLPAFVGHGQSYFITRLFRDLAFPEADLAGTNLRLERQRRWLERVVYAAAAGVTLLAAAAWTTSYTTNKAYVSEVDSQVQAIQAQIDAMDPDQRDLISVLPLMDALRNLPGGYAAKDEGVPLLMGLGLYQGDKLGTEAKSVYQRVLRRAFLPRVILRLEDQLRSGMGKPDYLYEALRVYLMLDDPDHFDAATVRTWMAFDWEQNLPRDVSKEQRQQLEAHLAAALEREAGTAPIPLDGELVSRAREVLLRVPLDQRIYARIRQEKIANEIPDFTISGAAGPDAPLVFVRKSGLPLNQGVPGLYTYDGYHQVFARQAPDLVRELASESWILGPQAPTADPAKLQELVASVRRLYLQDYIARWSDLLDDLDIAPFTSLRQGVEILRVLSGPDSPLKRLLVAVARETMLDRQTEAETGLVERATDRVSALRDRFGRLFSERAATAAAPDTPERQVSQRFEPLNRLVVAPEDGAPPIDGLIASLNELYLYVNAIASAADRGGAALEAARSQAGMGGDVVGKVRTEADRLPLPLQGWVKGVAADSAGMTIGGVSAHLNNVWTSTVLPFYRQAISGRYPLVRSSDREATLEDFGRFFGPGGLMDDFFKKYLESFVDTSGSQWSWRAAAGGSRLGISNAVLQQFQNAAAIRDAFFPAGGQTPAVSFTLVPQGLDAGVSRFLLDLEGQLADYRHGPTRQVRLTWPAANSTGQVRLVFEDTAGNRPGVTETGPWAWFRVLDKATVEPTAVRDRFKVTFSLGGHSASYELQASSVRNPFKLDALEAFRCPERL
ncbi:type VI secretion system membrane subunit TssM [Thioalbus denitrificans]|uniref:Type VI secretion system protein ImpL n=1 Tax=Thioalbus denitrificans TaxID=547122 RepID=A0A369CEY9_9GAMM|nr:type VI secretion system membrane subunit TssM [Thioalbus denitrificans]RCX31137.1 type VI secretion system protein ImpL [Thioalbus denitrificans]